jgi:hypothetical protein
LGAVEQEVDLNPENAGRCHALMAPFVSHARKAGRAKPRPGRAAPARQDSAGIRAWAKECGIHINDRGRIPADVVAQYDAAATDH